MGLEGILRTSIEFDPYSRLYSSSHITDKGLPMVCSNIPWHEKCKEGISLPFWTDLIFRLSFDVLGLNRLLSGQDNV